jgi:protein arginine N-methyltransferase 3
MEVVKGNLNPDVSTTDIFLDEKYLQPVIEDDALLFSLDDLESFESEQTSIPEMSQTVAPGGASNGEPSSKIKELEEQLAKVNSQYAEYREYVQQILDKRWQDNESASIDPKQAQQEKAKEGETSYFESYSYNGTYHVFQESNVTH